MADAPSQRGLHGRLPAIVCHPGRKKPCQRSCLLVCQGQMRPGFSPAEPWFGPQPPCHPLRTYPWHEHHYTADTWVLPCARARAPCDHGTSACFSGELAPDDRWSRYLDRPVNIVRPSTIIVICKTMGKLARGQCISVQAFKRVAKAVRCGQEYLSSNICPVSREMAIVMQEG